MDDGVGLIGIIVVGVLVWFGYRALHKTDYSKPWWRGTQVQRV